MSDDVPRFAEALSELTGPKGLSEASVGRIFDAIFAGAWTPVQVAGLLVALRLSGESPELIAAAARSLRNAMIGVEHDFECLLDTCGTGGDGHGSLNLSTAAAIIAASCGVPVAKHGNRAVSSRAGSADVIEALGIPLDLPAAAASTVLRQAHIAFLLAPTHHPAMRHAAQARRELGIRSVFNCLGPLANPARATHQLIGAYDDALRSVFARTLRALGTRRAWIVHGRDGLDEVSPEAPTRVSQLDGDSITEFEVEPGDFGVEPTSLEHIGGGDAAHNAGALVSVLSGEQHPALNAVILNAAAALVVGQGSAPKDAARRAREAIASGAASRTLERWRTAALAAKG